MFVAVLALGGLSSCMGDVDEPDTDGWDKGHVTSATSVGEVNTTIYEIKAKYCAGKGSADGRNNYNWWSLIKEDLVFEAVVVGNDVSGNLYQTILLRSIDETQSGDARDQSIQLALKYTWLTPYFALGQRVRINLKGFYVGAYSSTPKIGHPYKTSYGNLNLGPAPMSLCKTNVQLIGEPNPESPELVPLNYYSKPQGACDWKHCPALATFHGRIKAVEPANVDVPERGTVTEWLGVEETLPKTFGPECLRDDGFGVDRDMIPSQGGNTVVIRTSTENEIAYTIIPEGNHYYTGMITFYDNQWQVQLRDLKDLDNERYTAE